MNRSEYSSSSPERELEPYGDGDGPDDYEHLRRCLEAIKGQMEAAPPPCNHDFEPTGFVGRGGKTGGKCRKCGKQVYPA